ncbi:MAG: hypothetical protein AABX45_02100, partial [Nanoarchaeota archaeon]
MALFKQNKRISDLPAPPTPDFQISKPNFEEDFPKYTPTISDFGNLNEKRKPLTSLMPNKMVIEETQDKKTGPIFI